MPAEIPGHFARKEAIPKPGLPDKYPWYLKPIPINTRDAHEVLVDYLDTESPRVARVLYSSITAEQSQIKYQELSNAIRDGDFEQDVIERWRQRYSDFVLETLAPKWRAADELSGKLIEDGLADWRVGESIKFTYRGKHLDAWIEEHGAALVKQVTETQRSALKEIIRYYTVDRPVSSDDLARLLRPCVGLTENAAKAVIAYREELQAEDPLKRLTDKEIEHKVQNYAHWLERRRATLIAETEIAEAYSNGSQRSIEQARLEGFFGDNEVVKIWNTAEDERVCTTCGALDGVKVKLDENFPGIEKPGPTAHPKCRCTLSYEVLEDQRNKPTTVPDPFTEEGELPPGAGALE